MTASNPKARIGPILRALETAHPNPTTALTFEDPFQLLVATILSAQCTDARVNQVTPTLFARFPTAAALASAAPETVEEIIRSTGFFRNKTKSLLGMARGLVASHQGRVPADMDALIALPGVARKTANVVLGTAFNIAAGVVVDTHVTRLSRLLGLSTAKDPKGIERDLMALVPQKQWIELSHLLILHGRAVCVARRPACDRCPIARWCPSASSPTRAKKKKATRRRPPKK